LPPLLHGRVYADFRAEIAYFATAFDLVLSLYQLKPKHPAIADLRESLRRHEFSTVAAVSSRTGKLGCFT